MKKNKFDKMTPICWITMGLTLLTVATVGCGRKSRFNAQAQENPSADERDQQNLARTDLTQVSISAQNLRITDAAVLAYDLVQNQLVLRTEQYRNQNAEAVWIWIHPQAAGLYFWGVCSWGRAQYEAAPASPRILLQGGTLISKELFSGGWGVFEIAGGASATVEWVSGGRWSWKPGPYPAPAESCNESAPQRSWAGFEINGTLLEDVRVSLPNTQVSEATGDRNFLDSKRILAQPLDERALDEHWGDGR